MTATALNKDHDLLALKKDHDLSPAVMSIDEVSRSLGLTVTQLKRRHLTMRRQFGFPPPLPGGCWTWSRRAFEVWVAANGAKADEAAIDAGNDNAGVDALISAQNAELRLRYGARS